jgi:hypothetical protein
VRSPARGAKPGDDHLDEPLVAGVKVLWEAEPAGRTIPLYIRITWVFAYDRAAQRWGQVHHHGSIDDPDALRDYRDAVAAAS